MTTNADIQWQPIERLEEVVKIIRVTNEDTREQQRSLKEVRTGTLDDGTVARIQRLFDERLELIQLFREQLARWTKLCLSKAHAKKIQEATELLDDDEKRVREVLKMNRSFVTVEQLLSMDDAELGRRVLSGELDRDHPERSR